MATYVTRGVVGQFETTSGQCTGIALDGGSTTVWQFQPIPTTQATSRTLTAADNGQTIECTATITLTVPAGLPANFRCRVMTSGTTSIASAGGTLLNGATTTVTRVAATAGNAEITITARASAANSYVVTGS